MKKNELTNIIRGIVAEEIRRELPSAIAEVFSNFMGNKTSHVEPPPAQHNEIVTEEIDENINSSPIGLKQSLKELFDGTNVIGTRQKQSQPRKYTSNPKLNDILNQTPPFTSQERTGAAPSIAAMVSATQGNIDMENPSFTRNMPDMGSLKQTKIQTETIVPPVSQAQLLRDDHAPLSNLPEGVSVMDVKQYVPPVVADALTRNYSQMLKLVDKKRGIAK
jgi:hypothetical protein